MQPNQWEEMKDLYAKGKPNNVWIQSYTHESPTHWNSLLIEFKKNYEQFRNLIGVWKGPHHVCATFVKGTMKLVRIIGYIYSPNVWARTIILFLIFDFLDL